MPQHGGGVARRLPRVQAARPGAGYWAATMTPFFTTGSRTGLGQCLDLEKKSNVGLTTFHGTVSSFTFNIYTVKHTR